jgi:peptide/nickel transport system substrate-binding protein
MSLQPDPAWSPANLVKEDVMVDVVSSLPCRGRRLVATARWLVAAVLAMGALACSPSAAPKPESGAAPSAPQAAGPSRTMVMIARGEPGSLAVKTLTAAGGVGNANPLFNATLDYADERGNPYPYLVEALPVLNSDTWRVSSDGRMETTHRLRPNLSWHDGTALAAEDFVFAWRVYSTPSLGAAASPPISMMDEIVAPDDRTVVIRWRQPFPEAATLRESFQALPRHILFAPFQQSDPESFANHPFWTHEYVGLGPYRVERWEPGTAIESRAFAGHALGQPRIERLSLIFMADPNAALARLLSGDAHIAIDAFLMYEQGAILEREWRPRNGGTVLYSPILYRNSHIMLRPEMVSTRALLDVRVRRALVHAMDKHGVNEALMGGTAIVTDSLLSPLADYYPAVDRAIMRYPYDLRRSQQLLEEAGLTRGGDGFYLDPGGESFRLDVRTLANPQHESENAIIVESFRRVGLNAAGVVFPIAQLRDGQAVSTFSGLHSTGASGGERDMGRYASEAIPRPENRWQGNNRGAWSNPQYDALYEAYNSTLERPRQIEQLVEMERIFTTELPAIPHFYSPIVTPHVAALTGPVARTTRDAVETVHVYRWEWQ